MPPADPVRSIKIVKVEVNSDYDDIKSDIGGYSNILQRNEGEEITNFTVTTITIGFGNARASYGGVDLTEISPTMTDWGTIRVWDCLSAIGNGGSSDKRKNNIFTVTESSFKGTASARVVIE